MTLFELFFLLLGAAGLAMLAYHMHLEAQATKHVENMLNTILDILEEMDRK